MSSHDVNENMFCLGKHAPETGIRNMMSGAVILRYDVCKDSTTPNPAPNCQAMLMSRALFGDVGIRTGQVAFLRQVHDHMPWCDRGHLC